MCLAGNGDEAVAEAVEEAIRAVVLAVVDDRRETGGVKVAAGVAEVEGGVEEGEVVAVAVEAGARVLEAGAVIREEVENGRGVEEVAGGEDGRGSGGSYRGRGGGGIVSWPRWRWRILWRQLLDIFLSARMIISNDHNTDSAMICAMIHT